MVTDCDAELPTNLPEVEPRKKWTFLAFIDARTDQRAEPESMPAIVEALSGHRSDQINILVQWGTNKRPTFRTYRFHVPSDHRLQARSVPLADWEVANPNASNGGLSVKCFLKYAAKYYPADNYGLIFIGQHGNQRPFSLRVLMPWLNLLIIKGLLSASKWLKWTSRQLQLTRAEKDLLDRLSVDNAPQNPLDFATFSGELKLTSLASGLRDLKGSLGEVYPNLIVLDVCSLAGVECMYELKDVADYVVASPVDLGTQASNLYDAWIKHVVQLVNQNDAEPKNVANGTAARISVERGVILTVDVTERRTPTGQSTMIDDLCISIDVLATSLSSTTNSNEVWTIIIAARAKYNMGGNPNLYDLNLFVTELASGENQLPSGIKNNAQSVKRKLREPLYSSYGARPGWSDMLIYFPRNRPSNGENSLSLFGETLFAQQVPSWRGFLEAFWVHCRQPSHLLHQSMEKSRELTSNEWH